MTGTPAAALAVLARIRASRPPTPEYERCDLCGEPVPDPHQHVVDIANRSLRCTCRPCYLLFTLDDARLAYRAVPDRYLGLPDLAGPVWDELELPVGTAFLFRNSALDRLVCLYPGPAGAMESALPLSAWDRVVAAAPALATMRSDVEALLVRASAQRVEAFVVPVDVCYELVGRLRTLWRGFDGGQDVHRRLDEFFATVRSRTKPAGAR